MNVALVTGAHGFVGRHVSRQLYRLGYQVVGLGHGSWSAQEFTKWGIDKWFEGDVTLQTLTNVESTNVRAILHCAGTGSVAATLAKPYAEYLKSTVSTAAVLEYVRTVCPTAKVVLPSSAGVYGASTRMPLRLADPLVPISPYGLYKKMSEELVQMYCEKFGIRASVVRLFSIFGVGLRKQLLWDTCERLTSPSVEAEFSGTGTETRDWLNVEDAAALLVRGIEAASTSCAIANGGRGVAVPIGQVVRSVQACLGTEKTIRFNGEARLGDPRDYQACIVEALEWGWRPTGDLEQGIRDYVAWYMQVRS